MSSWARVFIGTCIVGLMLLPVAFAQGPTDITRIEGRVDRLNERLEQVESAVRSVDRLTGEVAALYQAIYYSPQSSITVRLDRIEQGLMTLQKDTAQRNTVFTAAGVTILVNLLTFFIQRNLVRKNGARR